MANRQEDIDKALELFQQAIYSLSEIKVILKDHYDYFLDFPVSRAYDSASNTAQALTYSAHELRKRTKDVSAS